jgi:hypothetical protein
VRITKPKLFRMSVRSAVNFLHRESRPLPPILQTAAALGWWSGFSRVSLCQIGTSVPHSYRPAPIGVPPRNIPKNKQIQTF